MCVSVFISVCVLVCVCVCVLDIYEYNSFIFLRANCEFLNKKNFRFEKNKLDDV